MHLSSLINYTSLIFEFIGVFLITRGFWNITVKDIENASGTFMDKNVFMARSLIFQKIDGQYGGVLLMIGIFLMFIGNLIDESKIAEVIHIGFCIILSILVLSIVFGRKDEHESELLKKFNNEPSEKVSNEPVEW